MPPTSLIESLNAVRRKVRILTIASGIGIVIASAVVLLLAIVGIDWALGLEKLPRSLVMIAAGCALLYVLWHWLLRPAMMRLNISDVAGRLEHTFPQFDDRLRSTVNFVQGQIPGSEVMQQLVVKQANSLAGEVNLQRVIVRKPVYFSTVGAIVAVAALAALVIFGNGEWLRIAGNRLMLGADSWPKSVNIEYDGKAPARVMAGQRFTVKMHLTRGFKDTLSPVLEYRYDTGAWQSLAMTGTDGNYSASIDARLEQGHANANLQVRVRAGDDEKQLAEPITVVPRLEITRAIAELTPPPYVQPVVTSTISLIERPAVAVRGSQIALRLAFNKPLDSNEVVHLRPVQKFLFKVGPAIAWNIDLPLPEFTWDRSSSNVAIARFEASKSFRFSVKATDTDGFTNAGGEEFEFAVKEDQSPTVQIEEPKRSEDRTPVAGFDVTAVAEDDYGVVGARLMVERIIGGNKSTDANIVDPKNPNHWTVDLVKNAVASNESSSWLLADSSPDHRRYHLGYHWELPTLQNANLKPGDVLEFYIQVKDNFHLKGREHDWVSSGKLRINIVSLETLMAAEAAKVQQIHETLKSSVANEARAKAETETVKKGLDRNKKFDEADKIQTGRLANEQASNQAQVNQLGDRLAEVAKELAENKAPQAGLKETAEQVQKDLRAAVEGPMRDAEKNLNGAKDKPQDPKADPKNPKADPQAQAQDAKERAEQVASAAKNEAKAVDQLTKAMEKISNFDGLDDAVRAIENAREQQGKLNKEFKEENKDVKGKDQNKLTPAEKERLNKKAEEQKDQAKALDAALDKMDKAASKMNPSDPAAEAMKDAAKTGKQKGLPAQQQEAAKDMKENQQSKADDKQQDIEIGLDQILDKLHAAQRKRLEDLSRQLAQMQQLINELVTRQAGHNIDNLLIQGGVAKLNKIDEKDRNDLLTYSGREMDKLPPAPQIGQLSASQEQTQRNAMDIAKQAESLPDPAPATKLTLAAGHMERAIVHLRNDKPVDAYKPPQVDAFATLLEAKEQIDKAAKKVEDKLEEQNMDSIKQLYVKLLEEQKTIGKDLHAIVDAPKDANGDIPRKLSTRLGQLPGGQGQLIDKAKKIGEQLKKLESVVYTWANDDIMKSMGQVKDNLAKPDTGKGTQYAEKNVEDQLQDMIDSLVQKMSDKKDFEQRDGGGPGQAKQKQKMPSEAELRLLKKNEQAVQRGTIEADKPKEKDKEEVARLSDRQKDIRDVFDKLIRKATDGKEKLGPPPDDMLPEEKSKDDIDEKELVGDLLGKKDDDKAAEEGFKITGDRMWRSGSRLQKIDTGEITQEIQKRIVLDIDALIKMSQQQQQQSKSKPGSKPGKMGEPKPQPEQGPQQASNGQKQGSEAAKQSTLSQGGTPNVDPSGSVKEALEQWGKTSQRNRRDVQEGSVDEPLGKYRKLTEDYYRSLTEQASKH